LKGRAAARLRGQTPVTHKPRRPVVVGETRGWPGPGFVAEVFWRSRDFDVTIISRTPGGPRHCRQRSCSSPACRFLHAPDKHRRRLDHRGLATPWCDKTISRCASGFRGPAIPGRGELRVGITASKQLDRRAVADHFTHDGDRALAAWSVRLCPICREARSLSDYHVVQRRGLCLKRDGPCYMAAAPRSRGIRVMR